MKKPRFEAFIEVLDYLLSLNLNSIFSIWLGIFVATVAMDAESAEAFCREDKKTRKYKTVRAYPCFAPLELRRKRRA